MEHDHVEATQPDGMHMWRVRDSHGALAYVQAVTADDAANVWMDWHDRQPQPDIKPGDFRYVLLEEVRPCG